MKNGIAIVACFISFAIGHYVGVIAPISNERITWQRTNNPHMIIVGTHNPPLTLEKWSWFKASNVTGIWFKTDNEASEFVDKVDRLLKGG